MCGIAAFFGNSNENVIGAMTRSLAHRGPDGEGIFIEENVGLGHRRLAIIDVSAAANQPLYDHRNQYVIIFNGEIYNYQELKKELEPRYHFTTQSDTEVLLASYIVYGEACVQKLLGMFAFIIYDRVSKKMFGARDHVGIKPLYYTEVDGTYYFASEIKALFHTPYHKEPNDNIIFDYLHNGMYDHTNETFFKNIFKIPAGHTFTLTPENNRIAFTQYWKLEKKNSGITTREEAIQQITALVQNAIALQLRSDVPVGINISSGFDSSALLSHANALTDKKITAFSMVYRDSQFSEGKLIAQLLSLTQNPWITSTLEWYEVMERAKKMAITQDEPFGGVPTIAYDKLMETEKKYGVPVILEGQGVDEFGAGYPHHVSAYYKDLITKRKWKTLRAELQALYKKNGLAHTIATCYSLLLSSKGRHYDHTKNTREHVLTPYIKKFKSSFEQTLSGTSFLDEQLYNDITALKLPRVLRFNDHASMQHSIEVRVPFLDHRIIELFYSLPPELKIKKGQGKYTFRKSMIDMLPDFITTAKKKNIVSPQTEWFSKELKSQIYQEISSPQFALQPYIDQQKALTELNTFFAGNQKNSFFIWQWLNISWWYNHFFIKNTGQ